MTPTQREELEQKLAASSRAAAGLFQRYSAVQLTRRPTEKSWSAAECLVHLSLSAAAAMPLVEAAVADLRSQGHLSSSPSRMDWLGRLLRWSLVPPPRFRVKTTVPFQPLDVEPLAGVLPEFLKQQERILTGLRAAEGLALSRRKMVSPVDHRVRYNIFSTFHILETHERRHLWQAEQALALYSREARKG